MPERGCKGSSCLFLGGAEGSKKCPTQVPKFLYTCFLHKKQRVKLVYHDLTSMKRSSVCFSTISQYMVDGIMPQVALQRKSAPLHPTPLPASLVVEPLVLFVHILTLVRFLESYCHFLIFRIYRFNLIYFK